VNRVGPVLVLVAVAAVVAAVAVGLAVVGSPEQARLEKLDRKRLSDLRRIAQGVNVYWTRYAFLPEGLESLEDELSFEIDLSDPETHVPYPYRVLGTELFQVCATFATKCPNGHRSCADWYGQQDARIVEHGPGEECFPLAPIEVR
jgi:hypothetical protein